MKFGITTFVTDETIAPAALGRAMEERGFDGLFLAEHSHIPTSRETPYPAGEPLPRPYFRAYDPFVALGAVAAVTEKLLLGTGITLLVQRDPIHTAKEVATLDQVSGGRAVFGVGAGWNREEMRNHGTDPRSRGALLDERLAAIREIWTKDEAEFHGKFVNFDPIFAWPKPVQRPHPPIYVGGDSDAAVARATRFGGWYPHGVSDPGEVAAQVGRVGWDVLVMINGVPPDPEVIKAYQEAGVERLTFFLRHKGEADTFRQLDKLAGLAFG